MSKTYFISGPGELSDFEFNTYYKPMIDQGINSDAHFVIGDFRGTDTIAQTYIHKQGYENVTVYHMFDKPRVNIGKFKTLGGFTSDKDRDSAMTHQSDEDIAYIRTIEEQKKTLHIKKLFGKKWRYQKSGTEKNIERRKILKLI